MEHTNRVMCIVYPLKDEPRTPTPYLDDVRASPDSIEGSSACTLTEFINELCITHSIPPLSPFVDSPPPLSHSPTHATFTPTHTLDLSGTSDLEELCLERLDEQLIAMEEEEADYEVKQITKTTDQDPFLLSLAATPPHMHLDSTLIHYQHNLISDDNDNISHSHYFDEYPDNLFTAILTPVPAEDRSSPCYRPTTPDFSYLRDLFRNLPFKKAFTLAYSINKNYV
ncbi:MAG: hypothetical protein GY739_16225 [Mesoflavibacter sp.]|nr:hypothetical protein [Mesoflavibacter sp.]